MEDRSGATQVRGVSATYRQVSAHKKESEKEKDLRALEEKYFHDQWYSFKIFIIKKEKTKKDTTYAHT